MKKKTFPTADLQPLEPQESAIKIENVAANPIQVAVPKAKSNRAVGLVLLLIGFIAWSIYASLTYSNMLPVYILGGFYEWLGTTVMTALIHVAGKFYAEQLGALITLLFLLGFIVGLSTALFVGNHKIDDPTTGGAKI